MKSTFFTAAVMALTLPMASIHAASSYKVTLGEKPPLVVLSGKDGEKLSGGGWNSNTIGGKVTVVMYVDPDKNSTNEHVEDSIRAHYGRQDIKVFGVVNTEATFIPNFMLRRRLSAKQARNPLVDLVLDYDRVLEKKWGLKDDRYNVMVYDKAGKLFFLKEGVCDLNDINQLLTLMKEKVAESAPGEVLSEGEPK
jgi:uncharacterized protein